MMNRFQFLFVILLSVYAESSIDSRIVPQHGLSLLYSGEIDKNIVHNHQVKMKWSKVRHYDGYDPATIQALVDHNEEEDMVKRPTLVYTLTQRLSNQVFSLLMSKLPSESARKIVQWKKDGAFKELDPQCTSHQTKKPTASMDYGSDIDDMEAENILNNQWKEDSCNVDFTSIKPYFGATFNLTLTLISEPMGGLSSDEVIKRVNPDNRGWTHPISTTDASIQLQIYVPDLSNETDNGRIQMAGNSRDVQRRSVEVDENAAEEVIELFLQKLKVILGGTIPRSIKKIMSEDQEVQVKSLPSQMKPDREINEHYDTEHVYVVDNQENYDIDQEIIEFQEYSIGIASELAIACWEMKMKRNECMEVQEKLLESDDESSDDGSLYDVTEEDMKALDSISTKLIGEDLAGGDSSIDWDLSIEELEELRRDMIALDNILESDDDKIRKRTSAGDELMPSSIGIDPNGIQWEDGENWLDKILETEDTIECDDCFG